MFEITEELLRATLEYLSTRPVREVDNIFHSLQQLKKIDTNPDHNPKVTPEVAKEVKLENEKKVEETKKVS